VFDRSLAQRFVDSWGAELIKLGYEAEETWIDTLPARRPELDSPAPTPDLELARAT
jgi:hypothetical protein